MECPYICPICGAKVPFFLAPSERSAFVRCPICGARIGKSHVPKESIIIAPTAYKYVGKKSVSEVISSAMREANITTEKVSERSEEVNDESFEHKELISEQRDSRRVSRKISDKIFYHPKTPCEVLAEVLDEFSFVNEEFKTFVVRRCERRGFLHPVELLQLLQHMKSGIRVKDEAGIIAEEYAVALQREIERAQRLGETYPYLSGFYLPENIPLSDPYVQKLLQIMSAPQIPRQGTSTATTYMTQQLKPITHQQQVPVYQNNPTLYIQPVIDLFKSATQQQITLFTELQKTREQLLATSLNQSMQQISSSVKEALKSVSEGMKALADAIKTIKSEGQKGLPPEVVDLLKENAEVKAKLDFYNKLLELESKHRDEIIKLSQEYEKRIEALKSQVGTAEFKSDDAKLVATALSQIAQVGHKLVDVIDKRQPLKIIVEALPSIYGVNIPKKYKKTSTSHEILHELEEEGLVEE